MGTIREKLTVFSPETVRKVRFHGDARSTVWDAIPKELRDSDCVVQVILNYKELYDEDLKTTYLRDSDTLILRVIQKGPLIPVLIWVVVYVIIPLAIGVALGYLANQLLPKPRTPRSIKRDSNFYGFDTPQLTTANGTPIQIVYGRVLTSGHLLNIDTDILDTTPLKKDKPVDRIRQTSILKMLVGLGEGGETGWNSIAGIAADADGIDGNILGENVFINDNPVASFARVNISTRLGTSHQSIPGVFKGTTTATQSFDDVVFDIQDGKYEAGTPLVRTYTTSTKPDKVEFNLRFDFLYNIHKGATNSSRAYFRVSWKTKGNATYTNFEDIRVTGKNTGPFIHSVEIKDLNKTDIDIKIEDINKDFHTNVGNVYQFNFYAKLSVAGILERINEEFTYPQKALLVVQAMGTEQLHGAPFNISAVVEGIKVRVYTNPTTYSYDVTQLDNPSWIILDLLTSRRYGLGKFITHVDCDIQSFIDAATYCNELVPDGKGGSEKRATLNVVLDESRDAFDWVFTLLRTAHLSLFRAGGKYRIKADQASSPVMMFTSGNMTNFKIGYVSPKDRVNYVEMMIRDEEDRFREAVVVTLDETITDVNDFIREDDEVVGVTRRSQASRLGVLKLNANKLLIRFATWEADVPAVRCEPNDVVDVAHDSVLWGLATGLVKSATTSTVTLDKEVTIEAGKSYKVRVWHKNETFEDKNIISPSGVYETVTISGTWTTIPIKDEAYTFGELTNVLRQMKIINLEKTNEMKFKLTGVEYNPLVYSDTIVDLESLPPKLGFRSTDFPPDVSDLILTEEAVVQEDGTILSYINVSFKPPFDSFIFSHSTVWLKNLASGSQVWEQPPEVENFKGSFVRIFRDFKVGDSYSVTVTTHSIFGIAKSPDDSPIQSITLQGKTAAPSNVTGFTVTRLENLLTFTWNEITDADRSHYEIRYTPETTTPTWDSSLVLVTGIIGNRYQTNLFFAKPDATVTQTFLIKAVDTSENYSATATTLQITIDPRLEVNIVISRDERSLTWPGTRVNFTLSSGSLVMTDTSIESSYTTPEVDVGTVARSRSFVEVEVTQTDTNMTWANATFTWGSTTAQNRTWAGPLGLNNLITSLEWRFGNSTPLTGSYKTFIPEEVSFRYAQFRVKLSTTDPNFGGQLDEMRITIDVPDRIDQKQNQSLVFSGSTLTVSYNQAFINLNSISLQVVVRDLANGERVNILNKTVSGFDIQVLTGASTIITGTRTADILAKGF